MEKSNIFEFQNGGCAMLPAARRKAEKLNETKTAKRKELDGTSAKY